MSALKMDDVITTNHLDISKYVYSFYSNIYKSNSQINDCDKFIESIKKYTPTISVNNPSQNQKYQKEYLQATTASRLNYIYISGILLWILYWNYLRNVKIRKIGQQV